MDRDDGIGSSIRDVDRDRSDSNVSMLGGMGTVPTNVTGAAAGVLGNLHSTHMHGVVGVTGEIPCIHVYCRAQ